MDEDENQLNDSPSSDTLVNIEGSENKRNLVPENDVPNDVPTEELFEIDYSDGRIPGDYKSIYPKDARKIYTQETRFYALVLALSMCFLFGLAIALVIAEKSLYEYYQTGFLNPSQTSASYLASTLYRLVVIFVSGIAGGSLFALRNVSKLIFLKYWHEDRMLWRLSFPFIGGVVAIFLALLNIGGILAPFREGQFSAPTFCAGYGFVVGYFADSVLRALSRIAGDFLDNIRSRESNKSIKKGK